MKFFQSKRGGPARGTTPVLGGLGVGLSACLLAVQPEPRWADVGAKTSNIEDEWVRAHKVCVGETSNFRGELGDTLAYRVVRDGSRLDVSYFAYWSMESPWGDEPLLLALAIDAIYSHLLFALPGLQYWLYGPADIEGAKVAYGIERQGTRVALEALQGWADDKRHQPVTLSSRDLVGPGGETWLLTDAWSHQLGAPAAAEWARGNEGEGSYRCYEGDSLVPLTTSLARDFRLGSARAPQRARPAWL